MNNVTTRDQSDYLGPLIARAAMDPEFDVQKLRALLEVKDMDDMRRAERIFNAALVDAQAEMEPINADADNPQTRSKYATYAAVDRATKPIYTRHGLAPSFGTEPLDGEKIRVYGILSHREGGARRYSIDMPLETKGIRGSEMMTKTHGVGSAFTYGKRYLLIGMFNLSIDSDDDGNAASRSYKPRAEPKPRSMDELVDVRTGEVVDHIDPFQLEMHEGQTWGDFVEPLQKYLLSSRSLAEWDEWKLQNQTLLLKLKEAKPQLFRLLEKNINPRYEELTKDEVRSEPQQ